MAKQSQLNLRDDLSEKKLADLMALFKEYGFNVTSVKNSTGIYTNYAFTGRSAQGIAIDLADSIERGGAHYWLVRQGGGKVIAKKIPQAARPLHLRCPSKSNPRKNLSRITVYQPARA